MHCFESDEDFDPSDFSEADDDAEWAAAGLDEAVDAALAAPEVLEPDSDDVTLEDGVTDL